MAAERKKRLDVLLVEREIAQDIDTATALIASGNILVNGMVGGKAGSLLAPSVHLSLKKKSGLSVGGEINSLLGLNNLRSILRA